ncbi:hypothetical protein RFN29_31740 [Mesorhizobium sp. VK22B]|uniref:Transposase n=1 Tax=Mesorhizobium captivum TaxID=3072319 RepID=A0ABU4ZC05_9HYPH|nr:hypothetical protein [Mesorhizobium sp. VK22B]MDX8496103.1 hypothetical protein [Mesorhizobium sp. VK22B]
MKAAAQRAVETTTLNEIEERLEMGGQCGSAAAPRSNGFAATGRRRVDVQKKPAHALEQDRRHILKRLRAYRSQPARGLVGTCMLGQVVVQFIDPLIE